MKTVYPIKFNASEYQRLTELAAKTRRSRAAVIRLLLEQADAEKLGVPANQN